MRPKADHELDTGGSQGTLQRCDPRVRAGLLQLGYRRLRDGEALREISLRESGAPPRVRRAVRPAAATGTRWASIT
jgi:hypothetical protein